MDGDLSHISHRFFDEQVDSAQVSLDSDEPLGLIAQDLSLAQHVPCISSMSIGPITRPCIDTFLCNPGTTMEHLSIGGEDECTSRLQGKSSSKKFLSKRHECLSRLGGGLMIWVNHTPK